jgi:hypothetical protein
MVPLPIHGQAVRSRLPRQLRQAAQPAENFGHVLARMQLRQAAAQRQAVLLADTGEGCLGDKRQQTLQLPAGSLRLPSLPQHQVLLPAEAPDLRRPLGELALQQVGHRLQQLVGRARAKELIRTTEVIDVH